MKIVFFFLTFILFFLTTTINAQETIYFDAEWKITTKINAVYYRVEIQNKKAKTIDYFMSGKKAQEVVYMDGKPEGKYNLYYNSGELKTAGEYQKGLKQGVWKTYYKNGKIKERGRFKDDEKVGVWKTFYKNI